MYVVQKISNTTYYVEVLKQGYSTKKKAIEFVESQLNSEELKNSEIAKRRNLQPDTEYYSKDFSYEIIEIQVD